MAHRIVLLPGDGIGPEVMAAARRILDTLAARRGLNLTLEEHAIGGEAVDATGLPLPKSTLEACKRADAVLLGAAGGPAWVDLPRAQRPETGLLALRRELGLFANLRPILARPATVTRSPVKREVAEDADILFVRELTGGIYFGEKGEDAHGAFDDCRYSPDEIARVVRLAADAARRRRGRLTLIDKANVLETSRLWRRITGEIVAQDYPELDYAPLLVDAASMALISRPRDFDVIVTDNLFGDILTDEASVLAGSIGVIPSASLGAGRCGLYEPVHGSAPDIAGTGRANPVGMIESVGLMLEHSLKRPDDAGLVRRAVSDTLKAGLMTADLGGTESTEQAAAAIAAAMERLDSPADERRYARS